MSVNFNVKKFSSDDYKNNLTKCFTNLKFSEGDKETNVRVSFETSIKILLSSSGIVSNPYEVINMFKAEEAVKNPEDGAIYFIDSTFKNIVIEYKRYKRLDTQSELDKAIKQIKTYMMSDRYEKSSNIYGFLFDGMKMICFYKEDLDSIVELDELSGTFNLHNFDFFVRTLANLDSKDVTPRNLTDDFKVINNTQNNSSLRLFRTLYKCKKGSANRRTDLLYREWEKMFKLSEADNETRVANAEVTNRRRALSDLLGSNINDSKTEYEVLFALHTTYSILIKLISINACKEFSESGNQVDFTKLAKENSVNDIHAFLGTIENGVLYKSFGITNMIQGDFFSWYIKESLDGEFYSVIKEIFFLLSKYQNFSLKTFRTKDYLQELYENTIPREIRHSFGEYYTPFYLADCVITKSLERRGLVNAVYKSLDPTCGSGTFVLANISKLKKAMIGKTNKEKLGTILTHAYGIDLNPLAVLSSKINYLINIAPLNDYTEDIEIPIYLGDSSYMPSICYVGGVKCVEYDFFTDVDTVNNFIHFCIPYSVIQNKKFISIMDDVEKFIVGLKKDKALSYFMDFVPTEDRNEKIVKCIDELFTKLIDLETKDLNSIWLGIFANYLKASTISDCDLVSGNPPWVDWKNLPEKYRDRLKISARGTNIFSDDKNTGGVSLNICALIALKCLDKYVGEDGELAFLMPKAMLFNKSFEGFRRLNVDNNYYVFTEIDDWEKGGKPFDPVTMKFCIYNIAHKKQETDEIPYKFFKLRSGEKINNVFTTFASVSYKFDIEDKKAVILDNNQNNPISVFDLSDDINRIKKVIGTKQYSLWHRGLGLYTPVHKLMYVKEHDTDSNLAIFETFYVPAGSNKKRPSGNRVVLEKKYVRPFFETPNLGFFKSKWDNLYTTYPYEEGQKAPIPYSKLQVKAPRLAHYLKSHQSELESQSEYNQRIQSNDEFYGIIRVGYYAYNDYFACMRDNNNVICCPIVDKIETHWGELMTPKFDGHIAYDSEITKDKPITRKEVLYLAGIVNCESVRKYIENSSDSQSIGSKFDINLPFYSDKNYKHVFVYITSEVIYRIVNDDNLEEDNPKVQSLMRLLEDIYLSFNDSSNPDDIASYISELKSNAKAELVDGILASQFGTNSEKDIIGSFN